MTRPDVVKAASKLAEFLLNPSPEHLSQANQTISYLFTTRFYAIEYSAPAVNDSEVFICASDAAYGDHLDRKSSEGYICKLYGGPVDWRAAKQKTVSTSTTEAELLAISEAGKRLYIWKRLFNAIDFNPEHILTLKCDNRQTLRLLTREDPQFHTKLRHIDIQHHWLRQEIFAKRIHVEWISTQDMPADGLTKILPRQQHEKFIQHLGIVNISHLLQN